MRSVARPFILGAVVVLAAARIAAGDPIQITSGSLTWPGVPGGRGVVHITLAGDGFTFDGQTLALGSGFLAPSEERDASRVPGDTVNLLGRWSGDVFGTATLNDLTFPNVGGDSASLGLEWTGSALIPAGFTGGSLTAPFLFTGNFAFGDPSQPPTRVFLNGSGTATLTFGPSTNPDFPNAFSVTAVRYDFEAPAATPEPASLLLLGTGAVGLVARRRRNAGASLAQH